MYRLLLEAANGFDLISVAHFIELFGDSGELCSLFLELLDEGIAWTGA